MKGSPPYSLDIQEEEEQFDIKRALSKYVRYWPWFLVAVFISLVIGYFYLRYAPIVFESVAKIKILDDSKELNISMDPMSILNGSSKINMDNEIEVIESYRILSHVVNELDLDVTYAVVGKLKTTQIWDAPFFVAKEFPTDSLTNSLSYTVSVAASGLTIVDEDNHKLTVEPNQTSIPSKYFPISVTPLKSVNLEDFSEATYQVVISPVKEVVLNLIDEMKVESTNKTSEILTLSLQGENPERNEHILNKIIETFNEDGILDRQLVSKRTVDFTDERIVSLSGELSTIEEKKESFQRNNNLSYIEADAGMSIQKKSIAEDQVNKLETQIELSKLLSESLSNQGDYGLLPADIGLESSSINSLVSSYNKIALERQKLAASAGENNPTLQELSNQLSRAKQNIINTVNVYQQQQNVSLGQFNQQKSRAGAQFSRIPEKQNILRSIERQQSIKESLYLLLLQKREEAAINYAVTAPSIKVVDYGLSDTRPVSPKKKVVYAISFLMGLLVPFGVLYMKFTLDTKIHERADVEKLYADIPIAAEIPYFENIKSFTQANDRSILAESFRILSTNVNYLLGKKGKEGKVVYVTSSVKEEGKTLVALNLSLAYASLKKKVLLVGADLRNPQLHTYFNIDKNSIGLSNYLHDSKIVWKDCINKGFGLNDFHKVCFSGAIPPNAPELLSSLAYEEFINTVKNEFDYVIVDCAPTLLVTDTLLISEYADATLFVVRADYTDKRLFEFIKGLNKNHRLKNMSFVINDVKIDKLNGYNYGYGYGYGESVITRPWYKRIFKKKAKKSKS
ncbi:MAG: polysaccharide biosynthesis tyrosine autokinase [Aequorivita sp.]|nr:polysaccharide biosynthesis tyrosine autokinase [Aequorivita sp.]